MIGKWLSPGLKTQKRKLDCSDFCIFLFLDNIWNSAPPDRVNKMLLITIYLESINGKDTGLLLQNWQLTLIEPELTFPNEMRWGSLSHMITVLSSWATVSLWISTVWKLNMRIPSGCRRASVSYRPAYLYP